MSEPAAITDDNDRMLAPYFEALRRRFGGELPPIIDVHTHIGRNDPDGFKQEPEELLAREAAIGARAVTFPMHEPEGYRDANDEVLRVVAESEGRLWALCRVDPRSESTDPVAEAERCLDAGAAGIKLHPRAEGFRLAEPAVERLFGLASERSVPILVHAGRGIPALGRDSIRLSEAYPGARVILAHGGISDLAWLYALVEPGSNVFFDTSWWNPADLLALFTYVPSSQLLWASDCPYSSPLVAMVWHLRCALEAGLDEEAIRSLLGGQSARILAGEETVALPRPEGEAHPLDPMLERVYTHLVSAFGTANGGGDPAEKMELARLSCEVPDHHPHAVLLGELEGLIAELAGRHLPPVADGTHRFGDLERGLVSLLTIARTPAAGPAAA